MSQLAPEQAFETALELARAQRDQLIGFVHRIKSPDDEMTICGLEVDKHVVVALTFETCPECKKFCRCGAQIDPRADYCPDCERKFTTGDQEWEWPS